MASEIPAAELLRETLLACKGAFIAAAFFSFVVNLLILTTPLYMFSMFTRVIGSGNLATLGMLFTIAVTCLLVQAIVDMARTFTFVQVSNWIDKRVSHRLVNVAIRNALVRGNPRTAEALNRLNSLRGFLAGQQIFMLMDAPWVPVFIGVLFLLNFWIGVVALLGGVTIMGLALANKFITQDAMSRAGYALGESNSAVNGAVRNAEAIESMGMKPHIMKKWREKNNLALDLQAMASRRAGIIAGFSKMSRMMMMMSVMSVAAIQIINPESALSPGAMMAAVILVGRAMMPLDMIINQWSSVKVAKDNYDFIVETLKREENTPYSSVTPKSPRGEIAVEGVSFHPRGAPRPVLFNINFALEPGEALGIVGPSGAGKTTLAALLVGLQKPSSGSVRLDGQDLFYWPSDTRGQYVGYLPQSIELFSGTVRENIARLDPDGDPEAIMDAAEKVGMHDMIQHFPNGYDTNIGEEGGILSGGQRQRVALARAFYGNPVYMVLDEPNSNLDGAGEAALEDALKQAKASGTTVIIIAHRPSVLSFVDKIMILQEGRIARFGERDQIMPMITGQKAQGKVPGPNVKQIPKQASA